MTVDNYSVKDFIDNDLKEFSNLDNVRSIPSLVDGLKDSQRKAVFGLIKHGLSEIKVSQLGAFVSMATHYDHGEVSMCDTVVGLAQDFAGSNNINLFEPIGQFGSILSSESSAHRYIFTKQSKFLRKYFMHEDDRILKMRESEGESYEPEVYLPLLPMWIVNGAKGIGTGHASTILSRNPKSVRDLVSKLIQGVSPQQKTIDEAMKPYFEGWNGIVENRDGDPSKWDLVGVIEKVNTTTLRVTELPVTYDVDKFKDILIKLMDKGLIKDFDNNSKKSFDFTISVSREIGRKTIPELIDMFKLRVGIGENVTLWDTEGKLKRFDNAYEALKDFVSYRSAKYQPRKDALLAEYDEEISWLKNKSLFIEFWNNKNKDAGKKKKEQLYLDMANEGIEERYFDSLLAMQITSLTMEKIAEHEAKIKTIQSKRDSLQAKTIQELYSQDLGGL